MPALREKTARATSASLLIGELAERSGVSTAALRYYDELGLIRPTLRETGGRRRYSAAAVDEVGVVRLLSEVGFTLAEVGAFLAVAKSGSREKLIDAKLDQISRQLHQLGVARQLLEHGRRCRAPDPLRCPRFWSIIEGRRAGVSLEETHKRAHHEAPACGCAR